MANDNRNNQRREHILAATLAVLLGAVLLTSHAVSGAMAKYTTAGTARKSTLEPSVLAL